MMMVLVNFYKSLCFIQNLLCIFFLSYIITLLVHHHHLLIQLYATHLFNVTFIRRTRNGKRKDVEHLMLHYCDWWHFMLETGFGLNCFTRKCTMSNSVEFRWAKRKFQSCLDIVGIPISNVH